MAHLKSIVAEAPSNIAGRVHPHVHNLWIESDENGTIRSLSTDFSESYPQCTDYNLIRTTLSTFELWINRTERISQHEAR